MSSNTAWFVHHAIRIAYFGFLLVFLSHLARQRKTPASTIAWLLIFLINPYAGIFLYLLLGTRKFLPSKPTLFAARGSSASPVLPDSVQNQLQRTLVASGSPLPSQTAKIEFYDTGERAYEELTRLIDHATKSVYLETYIFSSDDVGRAVLASLEKAAQRGVDVRLLIDAIGARLPGHPCFKNFKAKGGRVAFFMPLLHRPFRGATNLRNHRKQMIVDGEVVVLGGMNIAREYMGPTPDPDRWKDLAVRVEGAGAGPYQEVFLADWHYATGESQPDHPLSFGEPPAHGEHENQLVVSGPDVQTDPIYELLLTAIYKAERRVWIVTPYFVPDDALAKALELAARRGIDVKLLIPRKSNHRIADLVRDTYVRQVQASGTHIYLFPRMIHAKATLVDDQVALLGSANTDIRSLMLNYELGLCLYSAGDVKALEEWFQRTLGESSRGFPKSRVATALFGNLARLLAPLV